MRAKRVLYLTVAILFWSLDATSCSARGHDSSCAPPFYTFRVNGSDERVGGCSGQFTYAGRFDVLIGHSITVDRAEWAPMIRTSERDMLSADRLSDHEFRLTVKRRGSVDLFAITRPDVCGSEYHPRSVQPSSPRASSSKPGRVRCYLLSIVGK